ncbi:UDP-N-acetylmuramyl pentapeptide phosphotransferase/UDP-N-acetylglucosamine-1-phosphate transferase [Novosphingobium marinum]|uniref:UDP-N-acetylmuramyl pentapeptide phosphotransferase/UDP-N-acetylglucosamine-1-phosphate transferase n=1 Tax=Novosphingobium marinum TaxID=1514948 RepID=A0A7Z0BV68_9SPHN|nr:UDP-N-acetylmuramyl pentapeptide phosphotransferase/UDP-N-acetylglucosamine-1-phosphate transferase [Novosphingobium marinum]
MPLWLELQVMLLCTYAAGFGIGWLIWNRKG